MGCGCGKNRIKNVSKNINYRPITNVSTIKSSPGPVVVPNKNLIKEQNDSGLTSEKRENIKKRREALLKKLGRI
jgi:hypothetical protein